MYGMSGMGQVEPVVESAGPPAPTIVQDATQAVKDMTGISISPFMLYGGLALLGWYVYTNYVAE